MDHSYSDIRSKINFFQPSDRQNFANALGQTCILDLRLRLNRNIHVGALFCYRDSGRVARLPQMMFSGQKSMKNTLTKG